MNIKPGDTEFSVGIDLDADERFTVDYRNQGDKIEVRSVRFFMDLRTGRVKNVIGFGFGIGPDGVVKGGRSRKLPFNLIPSAVTAVMHDEWDKAAEEISDVEELTYA